MALSTPACSGLCGGHRTLTCAARMGPLLLLLGTLVQEPEETRHSRSCPKSPCHVPWDQVGDGKPQFPSGSERRWRPGRLPLSDPQIQLVGTRPIGRPVMRLCPGPGRGPHPHRHCPLCHGHHAEHVAHTLPRGFPGNPRGLAPTTRYICPRSGDHPEPARGPRVWCPQRARRGTAPPGPLLEESRRLCVTTPGPHTSPRASATGASPEPPSGPVTWLSF